MKISKELSAMKQAFVTKTIAKTPTIKNSEIQDLLFARFGQKMAYGTLQTLRGVKKARKTKAARTRKTAPVVAQEATTN